ncbi:ABC transporter substrate-binding protein [Luethyella okanaganae]|uniref:ABC transporter substrate-binding protein n=1 Tax=Luethyella okanaganae TaxID=69372 RepID=A0ABW1VG66_9MICO
MKMSHLRFAAAFVASALLLSGCGGTADPAPTETAAGETPVAGGDLSILVASGMTNWDPGASTGSFPGVVWDRLYAVYGALITVDVDGRVQPGLAESLTTDDGGTTWTLTLRDGLAFTDGTTLDSGAVKANWDRFAEPANALGAARIASTFTSKVVDATTLAITPSTKNPILDKQIADAIPFVASPATFPAGPGPYTTPVGAGPYVLEKWDPAVGETLVKNADYYDDGLPYLDSLTFTLVADPAQRVSTVVQGGAQSMNGYPFQFISDKDNPAVSTFAVASGGVRHLVFNTQSDLFGELRARQAVQLAIDPAELVQTLTQDPSALGGTSLFPEDSQYYDASAVLPKRNLEKAQALVDELKAEGADLQVDILVAAVPELVRAGELLQLTLQQLDGLTVTVNQIPIPEWRAEAFDKDNFDITFYPGVFDLNSPEVGMANLFGKGGLDNVANFGNDDMNAAIDKAQKATSDEARVDAIRAVQEVYVREIPIVAFGIDHRTFLHGADVTGFASMGRGALYTDRLGYVAE